LVKYIFIVDYSNDLLRTISRTLSQIEMRKVLALAFQKHLIKLKINF